jgi:cobalt-zinc-cadmium efflux system outer membrane protein
MRVRNFRSLRDIERRNAESELDMARRRLALEWGADQLDAGPLQLDAPAARDIPDTTALYARLGEHPSLRAAASEAALESWRVREAKAARVPDVTVSAAVRHLAEVPGTGFAAELSLPLPLWNSGSSATTAAERERDAAIASVESARRRLREEVGAARDRCIASFETYERLRTEARPAAEEAMSQIVAAFRAGRLGYLDLQEGERSRIETDLLLAGATADVWRARLALEALIGTRLDDTKEER